MDQTITSPSPAVETTPTTLPSSKVLFKEALATYRLLWKKLFLVALVPGIINVVTFYVGNFLEGNPPISISEGLLWFIVITTGLFSVVVYLASQITTITIISNAHKNIVDTVSSAWKESFSVFFNFLFITFLTVLVILGGYLAFFIPGVLFALYISYGLIVLVDEKEKGYNALVKSFLVSKGKFWEVFAAMFKVGLRALIFIIPLFILSIGSVFLGSYLDFGSFTPSSPVVQNGVAVGQILQGPYTTAISQILNMLTSALIYPFIFIVNYRIYAYLRFIKGNITPEETQKAKKTLKIFTGLGVVAFIGLVVFFWYAFSTGMFTQ